MPKTPAYLMAHGWTIVGRAKGTNHILVEKEGRRPTKLPSTPSDRKSDAFCVTRMRRADNEGAV